MIIATLVFAASLVTAPSFGAGFHAPIFGQDAFLDKLIECDKISKRQARKNCIERVLAEIRKARGKPSSKRPPAPKVEDLSGTDQTAPQPLKSGSTSRAQPAPQEETQRDFTAGLLRFEKDARGRFFFFLDNGQIWRETKGSELKYVPKNTQSIRIKRGVFGGWRVQIPSIKQTGNVTRIR